MAIRKPKAASRQQRTPKSDLMDVSSIPAFVPTPEQAAEQRVKLEEWLRDYQDEFGEFTDEELEAVERAWPDSR